MRSFHLFVLLDFLLTILRMASCFGLAVAKGPRPTPTLRGAAMSWRAFSLSCFDSKPFAMGRSELYK